MKKANCKAPLRIGLYGGLLSGGGAERVLSTLANNLSARGHRVTFFCDYMTSGEYDLDSSVDLVYLGNEKESFAKRNLNRVRLLHNAIKSKNIQVLLSFLEAPSFRAAAAVCGTQAVHVLSVRNDPSKEYPGVSRVFARIAFRRSGAIVFQTSDAMASFSDVKVSRRMVIANPVHESSFIRTNPGSSHKVVTLGRLSSQKNHKLLIDAFAEVAIADAGATLEIYGAGELERELLEQIDQKGLSGRAFIMGRTDRPKRVLEAAGVFVLSSDYEGMPNALMEAMAAGLPVISTDCPIGGPKELIRDGETGILVPVGSVSELAKAMKILLSDSEMRCRMGARAQGAMSKFRMESIIDEWEGALEEVYWGFNEEN